MMSFVVLPSVPSLSGFSRGDLFCLLPRCFVRCYVGRCVARWARRVWCVAAGGGMAGVLAMVVWLSEYVAYKCLLRLCLLSLWVFVFLFLPAAS